MTCLHVLCCLHNDFGHEVVARTYVWIPDVADLGHSYTALPTGSLVIYRQADLVHNESVLIVGGFLVL